MRRTLLAAALAGAVVLAGRNAAAQAAPPTPAPTAVRPAPTGKAPKAPLDFAGTWEIDLTASKGVSKNMEKAVLTVRQNGDRIWIQPIEQRRPYLTADEIVVDGQKYEKALGRGMRGSVQAEWGKDKKSLWIQSVTSSDENPKVAFQRSVWELKDGGKVWSRRTWTVQNNENRETLLVFKKREAAIPPPPKPTP
ncbi:MAG TPA: hypothetical protein VGG65_06065 [Thermoanaerobaculia bacterium]